MEYFGTNLTEYGHFRWLITDNGLEKVWNKFDELPFHPENLTNRLKKGQIAFYEGGGYSVLAIAGSPKDDRGGTKSVFWVKSTLDKDAMIDLVKRNEVAMSIIKGMPFEICW